MYKTIKTLFLFGMLLGMCSLTEAQQSVNSGGGEAMGSGGTASYSIGQIAYYAIGADGTTVSQGVQQASQAQAIPTVSEWGFIILLLLFIIFGVQSVRSASRLPKIKSSQLHYPE